jgi:hypothetical protein
MIVDRYGNYVPTYENLCGNCVGGVELTFV